MNVPAFHLLDSTGSRSVDSVHHSQQCHLNALLTGVTGGERIKDANAVSIFAFEIRILMRYPFLNEGLTELLISYIPWKHHTHCYEAWKQRSYPCRRIASYADKARITNDTAVQVL